VSEKVIEVINVNTTNTLSTAILSDGGSGYSNSDIIHVESKYTNARISLQTNSVGGITDLHIFARGSGFINNTPSFFVSNSTGGASGGSGAMLTFETAEHKTYFEVFENITQPLYLVGYSTTNNQLLTVG